MTKKIWDTDKLENCVYYLSRGKSPSYVSESSVYALNQKAIRWGYIDKKELKYHNPDVKIPENHFIKKGDIVINSTGDITIGRAYYFKNIDYKLFADSHVAIIRTNPQKLNALFLSYLFTLDAYQTKIYNLVTGATGQLELSKNQLAKLEIDLPPLPIQQRIASILSAYDDLIEVNNQRIKLLEETARELYKEWFVRMRFPGYKQAKFKKGVPEGWEIVRVDSLYKTSSGGTPSREKKEYYENGIYNWIKTGELKDSFVLETEEKISESGLRKSSAKLFPVHTTIFAMYGNTIGQLGITSQEAATNQACCALLPLTKEFDFEFIFLTLLLNREIIISFGMGAAQQNVNQDELKKFKILKPISDIALKFKELVNPMFEQIKILQQQNTQLRQIRDRLLPRLVSGKIEISFQL